MEEKVDTLTKNLSDEKANFENKLKEQSLQHEAALRCLQEDFQREKDEMVIDLENIFVDLKSNLAIFYNKGHNF